MFDDSRGQVPLISFGMIIAGIYHFYSFVVRLSVKRDPRLFLC